MWKVALFVLLALAVLALFTGLLAALILWATRSMD